jgi:micrococcal nuclease
MTRTLILTLALATCSPRPESHPYRAIDGDTISVGYGPHIRLARIDAPEMPGHCRPDRQCIAGDPYLARDQLQTLLDEGALLCIDTQGHDPYGRRIAECWVRDRNISNALLAAGVVGLYRSGR